MGPKSLIISLHDVTPRNYVRVRQQIEELAALDIHQTSLLVVPHFHGEKQLDEDQAFCKWLLQLQGQGHEIVLHGWTHQVSNLKSQISNLKCPFTWFYENLYTAGEAEFLNLDYKEAHTRIGKGLAMFRDLGLNTRGFIAPAWLMNPNVERAAKDHGLIYSNTISKLIHLPTDRSYSTRSCVWSTRAFWRRVISPIWNSYLFHRLNAVDPLRISLHPNDLDYPKIWEQIKTLVRLARCERKPTTYADWIQRHE